VTFLVDVVFMILWNKSLDFSPAKEVHDLVMLLPCNFPTERSQPFVVLTFQRTGSNLLCGKLHNHAQVVMHNEVFNNAKIWTYQNEDLRTDPTWSWNIFSRDSNPVEFLMDLFKRETMNKKDATSVGFKLFPDHFTTASESALRQVLADGRIKKIILRRENYLDVYVSKLRADMTNLDTT